MRIWLDAQLSPLVASWLERTFSELNGVVAVQADLELRALADSEIFRRAGEDAAVVMTKDRDFVDMLELVGPPPQVIWLTCGNTSNRVLRGISASALPEALALLRSGEPLVEITDR